MCAEDERSRLSVCVGVCVCAENERSRLSVCVGVY